MTEKENIISVPSKKRKKKKGMIAVFTAVIFVVAAGVSAAFLLKNKNTDENKKEIITTTPYMSTIELTVSGSGTVEPLDRYEIVSLVSGDVISSPYEEGDMVKEDAVIYIIDHEEQNKNIESAKNSLTKSKIRNKIYLDEEEFNKTLDKYTVRAEESGIISGFSLEADDKVNANAVLGTIQNFDEIKATVPFNAVQFEKISVGDRATVYLYPSMYTTEGTVSYKSYKTTKTTGGAIVYDVEIVIDGSNITLTDTAVSATVHTQEGDVEAPESGTLDYNPAVNIFAEVTGDVLSVSENVKNGAKVNKGDVLFIIDSSEFLEEKTLAEFDYHDLELNLQNAEDKLENYNIKSPISGTVITKNAKKGDTISGGNGNTTLMIIADMSAMKFTFQADETDIEKIKTGQEVKVTADAVENKIFKGIVESIATEGVSSNGVSYYDVEVVINDYGQNDKSGALRSGMNVSAEIIYEKAENVLCVPVSAVKVIGTESYVFVKKALSKADKPGDNMSEAAKQNRNIDKTESGNVEAKGEGDTEHTKNGTFMPTDSDERTEDANGNREDFIKQRIEQATPEGFTAVKVETGVSDGINIAILSGIKETDEIYLAENNDVQTPVNTIMNPGFTGSINGNRGGMPGMMGGMPGGSTMGGGFRGGMSGGMR